jgi:hypothetical protein
MAFRATDGFVHQRHPTGKADATRLGEAFKELAVGEARDDLRFRV